VLEACQRATGLTPAAGRALLGRFLFSGEDAEKPLDGLSGGERRRLSLAILVQSGANVLNLDEPTNHLDVESREALEDALLQFTGSLLLISHDRALLDAVGTRTVAFEDRTLRSYVGGWPEYLRVRQEREAAPPAPKRTAAKSADKPISPKPAGPSKNARAKQASLELEIEQAEAALRMVEAELADPGAWATPELSAASSARHEQARRAVDVLYARYEEIAG
jgi:ATP-binding cassette subfamily F protein 3